ncbi:class I SAM-dependent methyltransferase [Skermania sp. ID1734]|uniref:THUMP-like domain-containing protein n=1 Tax=Skermania sp. ID1734 TaxID=2597516 RepID=UPI00117C51FA|nr:class I SAM-dependent methyltransferase [Skermania sp. ID1734]TSE00995.1 class I SAM-dependent methyltransferase [Skermania sp. ID1734]
MSYRFDVADVEYLTSSAGMAALESVQRLDFSTRSHVRDVEVVRREFGARAPVLVETVRLRRKSVVKFPDGQRRLFTDDALQQATPTVVARHRARRLAGRMVHDITCSVGAELDALVPVCPTVLGSDLDPVRLAMAAYNVPGAALARADALTPCSRNTVVLADPGRRADGKRTHDPNRLQPPLPALLDTYCGRDLVVKCAPGLDFGALDWSGEIEVVSLDGGVREACLWSAGLSENVRRRATMLSSAGRATTLTDADPDDIPIREPGEWIIDPDGAVVRASLVRHYAARHGLWQLDPRIAYVTGNAVPAGVRGFRVLARLKFAEKALCQELSRLDAGTLEILVRGVDVDPDALRKRLKLRGTRPYALVVTRIGDAATVFVCEPGAQNPGSQNPCA